MKKALHLLNSIKHGGAENVAYNYAKILNELDVNSVFIALPESTEYLNMLIDNGISVERKLTFKLLSDADYLFVHSNKCLIKLLPYFLLLKSKKIKVIYVQHLFYTNCKFRLLSLFVNFLCTDFIQITPITSEYVNKYINIRISFIVNFYINKYDVSEWTEIRNEVRSELGIPCKNTLFMFSGVFKPGKNVGEFVTLASTCREDTDKTFLLIGDGIESDIVKKYSGENLKWIGFVNDVERYLIASDVYLFLSKFEMMPMALLEAINTEKIIIAYSTCVNDFLLQGCTFETIDKKVISDNSVFDCQSFKKYDRSYALLELRQLLCL